MVTYESVDPACSAQERVKDALPYLNDSAVYSAKRLYPSWGRNRISFHALPTPTLLKSATTRGIALQKSLLTRAFPMGIVYLTS